MLTKSIGFLILGTMTLQCSPSGSNNDNQSPTPAPLGSKGSFFYQHRDISHSDDPDVIRKAQQQISCDDLPEGKNIRSWDPNIASGTEFHFIKQGYNDKGELSSPWAAEVNYAVKVKSDQEALVLSAPVTVTGALNDLLKLYCTIDPVCQKTDPLDPLLPLLLTCKPAKLQDRGRLTCLTADRQFARDNVMSFHEIINPSGSVALRDHSEKFTYGLGRFRLFDHQNEVDAYIIEHERLGLSEKNEQIRQTSISIYSKQVPNFELFHSCGGLLFEKIIYSNITTGTQVESLYQELLGFKSTKKMTVLRKQER